MSGLLAAYLFGSVVRGDSDALSDLDVLAIVEDGGGRVDDSEALADVPWQWRHLKPSISWYGRRRLAEMFKDGDLFAWHLYLESMPLNDGDGIIAAFGKPAPYREALADIRSFTEILAGIPAALALVDRNAVYEAGLIYVCMRNIGMSASSSLSEVPDFSRFSVFRLAKMRPCPISREEFEITMRCRMAGRRGLILNERIDADWVLDLHARIAPWLVNLTERVECL